MRLQETITPLFGVSEKGQPVPVGTGFLVELPPEKVLVTAAHVLDERSICELTIPGRTHLIPLEGQFHQTKAPNGDRNADKIDVGFVRLPADFADKLRSDLWFMPPQFLLPDAPTVPPYQYSFCGFPHKATELIYRTTHLVSTLEKYDGQCREEKFYKAVGASPTDNLAIEFNHKRVQNQEGRIVKPKERNGVSGGPVFVMTDGSDDPKVPPIRVAGIAIEHHKNQMLLLATKINHLIQLIEREYPPTAGKYPFSTATAIKPAAKP